MTSHPGKTFVATAGCLASLALAAQTAPPAGSASGNRRHLAPLPFARTIAPHDMSTSQVLDVTGSPDVRELPATRPLSTYTDLVYARVKTLDGAPLDLKLDLQVPTGATNLPLVVFITGGGFMASPKRSYADARAYLARAGYAVASIEYRVVPQGLYSDAVRDVKSAIRFLRAQASRYGIDKAKVGVWGDSAGGYLSAMVATTNGEPRFIAGDHLDQSSDVSAGVDFYGLSDLSRIAMDYDVATQKAHVTPDISEALYLFGPGTGKAVQDDPRAAAAANPVTYVDRNDPPMLFIHGGKDILVSPSQTLLVHNALRSAGVPSIRYVIPGANHGGPEWSRKAVMDLVVGYFDRMLKQAR